MATVTNAYAATTTTTTLKVGLAATPATAVTTEPYGTNVTLTATVSGTGAAGTVNFTYGTTPTTISGCGAVNVVSGSATCSTALLPVATAESLKAAFTPTNSANFTASSTATATAFGVTVVTTTTTLKVGLAATPATVVTTEPYGTNVTLTATVTGTGAAGTVNFTSGTTPTTITGCGAVNVVSGTATCTTALLPVATAESLKAAFTSSNTANYSSSSTATATAFAVTAATPTVSLTTSPSGSVSGGTSVTLTATLSSAADAGTVSFTYGTTSAAGTAVSVACTGVSVNAFGIASCATTTLPQGSPVYLKAVFTPTTAGNFSASSFAGTGSITVTKTAATPTLTVSAGPYYYGSPETLTATMTPSAATGTVTFMSGAGSVGSCTLSSGTCNTVTSAALPLGSNTLTAVYGGDTSYAGSTSTGKSVSVVATPTSVALHATASTEAYGSPFTLTATVSPTLGSATVSAGSVTFYDSSTNLGKVTVNSSGVATLVSSSFPSAPANGKHFYIASYGGVYSGGAMEFSTSLSASAPVTIAGLAPLTITASSATVAYGAAVPTITPTFSGWVNTDSSASLTRQPTCTTTYTPTSVPGTYPSTCSGAVDANYTITPVAGTVTVGQAAATFSHWNNSSAIYGTPVALSAVASSGLTVSYTVISGPGSITGSGATLTPSGVGAVTVQASVAGSTNYAAAQTTKIFTFYQAPLLITASSPTSVTGGTVPTITASYATFVNGDTSASLTTQPTCRTTYKATSPNGTYSTSCSGAVDPNYSITYAAGSFTISQAAQTIKNFYPSPTAYGTPVTLSATASSGLTVTYTISTTANGTQTPVISGFYPSAAGTFYITASQVGNSSFAAATPVQKTVTIYQAPLTVTAPNFPNVKYGDAVPTITLSASNYSGFVNSDSITSLSTAPKCITTYTTTSNPGSYDTVCYGAVDPNYKLIYVTGTVTVSKAPAVINTQPTSSVAFTYGTALGTNTNLVQGTANVAGTFTWTIPVTIPHVGGAAQSVTFTPTASTDYTAATTTVALTVNKATPTISTPPTASATTYGSALSTSKLSGGVTNAILGGTFQWTSGTTTLTTIGVNTGQGVTFLPSDSADYNQATTTASVTVNKATAPVTTWPSYSAITYGQPLSSAGLTGGVGGVPGTFAWANPSAVPAAGTATESMTFTPTTTTDYSTATHTVTVTVTPKTATVNSWPTASAITYPQTLASSTLTGGSANTAGHFTWTTSSTQPDAGSAVAEGVTFTPTNTTQYGVATSTVNVLVNQAATTVITWPTFSAISSGSALSTSTPSGGSASVGGSFAWTIPATVPAVGTTSYGVTFTPSSADYTTVNDGWASITVNACGLQDSTNAAYSTALDVYTAAGSLVSPTLDAEGSNVSAICAVNSTPGDGTTVAVSYPYITSNAGSAWAADSNSNGSNAAVLAYGTTTTAGQGAIITIADDGAGDPSSISTASNNSPAVFASMGGAVNITDANINTYGNYSYALDATYGGSLTLNSVTATTNGNNSAAIMTGIGGANVVSSTGGNYTTNGTNATGVYAAGNGSTVTLTGDTVTANNWTAVVVEGGNTVTIGGGASLTGALGNNHGIFFFEGSSGDATAGTGTFTMTDGSITYNCDANATTSCATGAATSNQNALATLFSVANTTATISLTDVTLTNNTNSSNNGILLTAAALNSGASGSNGGNATLSAYGETLVGDVIVDPISTVTLNLNADSSSVPSTLTGAINSANSGATTVSLTLDATSSWVVGNGSSYLTTLTNAGSGNITCQNYQACSVYVGGTLLTGIN